MVQPRYVGAEKQSTRAQQAVRGYKTRVAARVAARIAIQTSKSLSASGFSRLEARVDTKTSKSQSAPRFSRLQVAIEVLIEALKGFKNEVAESKGLFPQRAESRRQATVVVAVGMQAVRASRMSCSSRVCPSSSRNWRGRRRTLEAARAVSIKRLCCFFRINMMRTRRAQGDCMRA
jgi:hypothetical protein